eukprot:CAMPEP_0206012320 /NCGR_PEP_ID=MMETSP1464-20131121/14644_1 /ASSEMBLY_ACC=CAM_ASM_001124 /TAXON_ID=119497 /ORGANISM="Exanthemachrysis gayraliae, Strain RCC1523" /LENGTH=417 /DNA_ID=CAMNT_0053386001 /DNA_START=31 /DNA_END=1285 /DNA_ORIENTATION=+
MTGGGLKPVEGSRRAMALVMPKHVTWIRDACAAFEPEKNRIVLKGGGSVKYDQLVVAAGLEIDWGAIKGLPEAIGHDCVSSIYDYRYAPLVFQDIQKIKSMGGGDVLFTQPKTGVKCGGAPQKIMWLADDWWRSEKMREKVRIEFCTGTPKLFAVDRYRATLEAMAKERNVHTAVEHNLVEVDGARKVATFELPGGKRVKKHYDMLHVTPVMDAPGFIKKSPLADATGYIEVDKGTLRHVRYGNVWAIGDSSNLPTSKTAAAVCAQAPVLAHNLTAVVSGKQPTAQYDGYTSCPIITRNGGLILAEFKYGGVPCETFPPFLVDQAREQPLFFYLKKVVFPWAYWNLMLVAAGTGPALCSSPASRLGTRVPGLARGWAWGPWRDGRAQGPSLLLSSGGPGPGLSDLPTRGPRMRAREA